MKTYLLGGGLLALCLTHPTQAQGLVDGFLRGKGRTTVALTYAHEAFDTYYVGTVPMQNPNLGTITTRSVNLYAAYGLTKSIDVAASLPFIDARSSGSTWPDQRGLQDASVAVKGRLLTATLGPVTLDGLVSGGLSLPVSKYIIDAPIAIGHGSTNLDGRAILHLKLGGFFLTGQYGYTRRSAVTLDKVRNFYAPDFAPQDINSHQVNVPDVTDLIVRGGFGGTRFYVDGWVQRQAPYQGRGTDLIWNGNVPFPTNAIAFTRAGANAFVPLRPLEGLGITAGFSTTLNGRNVGKATRFSGGLVYNF